MTPAPVRAPPLRAHPPSPPPRPHSPPLERVGMLDWSRFDQIVEQGYQYARQKLAEPGAAPRAAPPQAVPMPTILAARPVTLAEGGE